MDNERNRVVSIIEEIIDLSPDCGWVGWSFNELCRLAYTLDPNHCYDIPNLREDEDSTSCDLEEHF